MSRWILVAVLMGLMISAVVGAPISLQGHGWKVTVDPEHSTLAIEQERLKTVLREVQLGLKNGDNLHDLTHWSCEKTSEGQLLIKTQAPATEWRVSLDPDVLRISCTSWHGVLTAEAPADSNRTVARVMDKQGVPVQWVGTTEVVERYGGKETRNISYLPQRNPDCMYFALGNVSGLNLHSLFDRNSDTVIRFSEQTRMVRDSQDQNLLRVTIPVPGNTAVRLIPDYFTKTLGAPYYIRQDDSHFKQAPLVWCSWTSYYSEVTEQDIVRNTDWIADNLKAYGFQYIQLDDGYDRGEGGRHYWIENWDRAKFPHGPKWLTGYIKSKGLRPGLWLVPNAYAGALEKHPEWYLRDKQGRLIIDYNTPALDSTNPEVLQFLRRLFGTLTGEWGFEYYKFDGEHAIPKYAPNVDKSRLHDKDLDPLTAYRNRLKVIREAVGPDTFIEGCPAGTPLNGIGYFNSAFTGNDVYNSWQGMYALFSSINANAFLNHMVIYVMPGEGIDVGPFMTVEEARRKRVKSVVDTARTREDPMVGFGVNDREARTLVSFVSLAGTTYPLGSVMPELPRDRVRLLKMTMPTMPILPIDLYSRGTDITWSTFKTTQPDYYIHNYPEILDLKVNAKSGVYDVVAMINWSSHQVSRHLSFAEKLGVSDQLSYVAFDYWGQKPAGVFKEGMDIRIEPHDTRVLWIRPALDRPQLIGTSRHITGACSISDLEWQAAENRLRGQSRTVPGEPYTLWIRVPSGMSVSEVKASEHGGQQVAVQSQTHGDSLSFTFEGRESQVDWQVTFTGRSGHDRRSGQACALPIHRAGKKSPEAIVM